MHTAYNQGMVDNSSGVSSYSSEGFDSTDSLPVEYSGDSYSNSGSVLKKVNIPPGYEGHHRATALKMEQESLMNDHNELKKWDLNCPCELELNEDVRAFAQTLDPQNKLFVDAVASVTPEMLKFAKLFQEQDIMWGLKNSKVNSCTLCHNHLMFHPELRDLFAHQDHQNNFKTTLSINTASLVGHSLLPGFLLALRQMVSIEFITMPKSRRMTGSVTHVCLANESDYNLACAFLAFFNKLPLHVFTLWTMEQKEDGQIVWTKGQNIPEILDWSPSTKTNNKDHLSQWTRRPQFEARTTFGLECCDGLHYIVERFPKSTTSPAASQAVQCWTKMTDVVSRVPISDVSGWITHEMENERYFRASEDMESGAADKSIAYFEVYKFDNTYSVRGVELFDTICVDSRSGTVCVQLIDGFMLNLSPTGIRFDDLYASAFEVQVNCKDMETGSTDGLSDHGSTGSCDSGECPYNNCSPKTKQQQKFKAPAQTFKSPAKVPSFQAMPSNTEQYYLPSQFGMISQMPQYTPFPHVAQTVYAQPLSAFAYQMNVVQRPTNFVPSYVSPNP